jgi:hypothetical protein
MLLPASGLQAGLGQPVALIMGAWTSARIQTI